MSLVNSSETLEYAIENFDEWSGEDDPCRASRAVARLRAEAPAHPERPASVWKLRLRQLLAEERKVVDLANWRAQRTRTQATR